MVQWEESGKSGPYQELKLAGNEVRLEGGAPVGGLQ